MVNTTAIAVVLVVAGVGTTGYLVWRSVHNNPVVRGAGVVMEKAGDAGNLVTDVLGGHFEDATDDIRSFFTFG